MPNPAVFVALVLVACKTAPSQSPPAAGSGHPTAVTTAVPGAPPIVALPAGRRFERAFRQAKLELGEHDVRLDNTLLESTGEQAVSITFGVIEHGYHNGPATLADHFEVVDATGHVAPLALQTIRSNEHNGGHELQPYDDGTYLLPMKDSVFNEIRLVFASPLAPPAAAVRITLDKKQLDIPLRFGPPTTDDVPPEAPATTSACDTLAKCCDAQTSADSKAACSDLATSARKLGLQDQCDSAAQSYCH